MKKVFLVSIFTMFLSIVYSQNDLKLKIIGQVNGKTINQTPSFMFQSGENKGYVINSDNDDFVHTGIGETWTIFSIVLIVEPFEDMNSNEKLIKLLGKNYSRKLTMDFANGMKLTAIAKFVDGEIVQEFTGNCPFDLFKDKVELYPGDYNVIVNSQNVAEYSGENKLVFNGVEYPYTVHSVYNSENYRFNSNGKIMHIETKGNSVNVKIN